MRPWGRFFARKIDIALIFMGMGYFAHLTDMQIEGSVDAVGYRSVLFMLTSMAFLEPIFLCAFGATPGKLILGIRVHQRGGGQITYFIAFSRTVKVLVRGLGLGFLVISIFCQLHALRQLRRIGITSWDREEGFDIEYMPFGFLRALLTCLVLLFLGLISLAVL